MAADADQINHSSALKVVMQELSTLSELKPGDQLAVSKFDHSFVIIAPGRSHSSVYSSSDKLITRLDDIQKLVLEILSPDFPLIPGQINSLSLSIFKALEAVKLNDENSFLLQKMLEIKDKIFGETSIKFQIPKSQSLPGNLSDLREETPKKDDYLGLLADSEIIEKSESQSDDTSSDERFSCTMPSDENTPEIQQHSLSRTLRKSPSSPELNKLYLEEKMRQTTPPPPCYSVPLSERQITPPVERAASSAGIYYTAIPTRSYSCVNQLFTEYNHTSKMEKYSAVLTSLIESFEACSEEIFDGKIISLSQILTELEPQIKSSNLCNATFELLSILNSLPHTTPRLVYVNFNTKLREILYSISKQSLEIKTPKDSLCLKIINVLCYIKYTGVRIYPSLQKTVDLFIDHSCSAISLQASLTSADLPAVLFHDNDQISHAPLELKKPGLVLTSQKLSGTFNVNFDPGLVINTPYVRSIQQYSPNRLAHIPSEELAPSSASENPEVTPSLVKETLYLRHGTPTYEHWFTLSALATASRWLSNWSWGYIPAYRNAGIIPEYEAFLTHASQKGDMILYCNHQKMEQTTFNDESDRCCAIKSLESIHKNFHFLSLPMGDGALFKESSEIGAIKEIGPFKTKFIEAYLQDKYGISIPQSCKDKFLKVALEKIFADVHRLYFENKTELTHHDKIVFTLAFNAYLKEYIKFHAYEKMIQNTTGEERQKLIQGKIITVSACKDNIDRGGTSTTLDEFLNLVILGQENNPERLKELRVSHAAPAILVKKQNVIPSRQILLEIFISHFNTLSTTQKNAIRAYSPSDWKLTNHQIA